MVVIGGLVFVMVAVLTGFSMAGGHIGALIHPSEFVTIGGASMAALFIMAPKKVLGDLVKGVIQLVKGSPYNKATYIELFGLLFTLTRLSAAERCLGSRLPRQQPARQRPLSEVPAMLHEPPRDGVHDHRTWR